MPRYISRQKIIVLHFPVFVQKFDNYHEIGLIYARVHQICAICELRTSFYVAKNILLFVLHICAIYNLCMYFYLIFT